VRAGDDVRAAWRGGRSRRPSPGAGSRRTPRGVGGEELATGRGGGDTGRDEGGLRLGGGVVTASRRRVHLRERSRVV